MSSTHPSEGFGGIGDLAAAMIESVLPGVVQVRAAGRNPRRGSRRGPWRGAGAGFIWSPEGSVMTNHHVVAGGKAEVVLADDRSFEAEVVGSSRRLDLAMLRLRDAPAEGLPTLPTGDSDALRVGELVFAVGHPWGRRGAVTAGIVSGLGSVGGRKGGPFSRARYVQSDAYLAPGNSGGPLVNAKGEIVGVNAMIFGGLSLAIPSNTAGAWASGGLRQGRSSRPRLGVRVQEVALPQESAGQETGLVISAVNPDSPAARAGLLVGDILLGVTGEPVGDAGSLWDALARSVISADVKDAVRLRIMRGGEVREVEVDLGGSERARRRGA